jgi:single-stranded-DNA-specific exonuclease
MVNGHATWLLRTGNPQKELALTNDLGISPTLARILVGRGIDTPAAVREFFDISWEKVPSPWLLEDMKTAATRLAKAIECRETVGIYGDYDVDGVTATALLVQVIRDLGGLATYYIPRRGEEGYGLHQEALAELASHTQLVVTVDCGITAMAEAEFARDKGLDLIITDHHQPGEVLPKALAIVNPNRPDCQYPTKELAGVGVAFKLAHAVALLVTQNTQAADEIVLPYLDLVALGTVADVVPLRGENRTLVHMGLERFARVSTGLGALVEVAGLGDKELSVGSLAFGLAPRINALGRLDDASVAVRLLLTQDAQEARQLAETLDATNRERQAIEARVTEEAMTKVEKEIDLEKDWAIVLASPQWHPGVIGIVASRLVEKYHRPTILISLAEEPGRGSGRSIEGFDLHKALQSLGSMLERYGGHKMAAGLSVRHEVIPRLRQGFGEIARAELTKENLVPKLRIDAKVGLDEINEGLLEELNRLAPYGVGNPQPILMAEALAMQKSFLVGKNRTHLKLLVSEGDRQANITQSQFEAIGFRMAERLDLVEEALQVDLAFQPQLNVWNGRTSIDLILKDLRLPKQELRQRYLDLSLDHYQEVVGKVSGLVPRHPMDMDDVKGLKPVAHRREVIDWRDNLDKGAVLSQVFSMDGISLLYVATPAYAMALAKRLTQARAYRGRVGIFYHRMPQEAGATLEKALQQGELSLVITAELAKESLAQYFRRLVLYHLPLDPTAFRYGWEFDTPELCLAYTSVDVDRYQKALRGQFPGREELAKLYVALANAGAFTQLVQVSRGWCDELGLCLDWTGICQALRVFSDLSLVEVDEPTSWEKADTVWVTLLPSPENKLDLTRSISYNECVKHRDYLDHYSKWALETPITQFQGQEAWEEVLGA